MNYDNRARLSNQVHVFQITTLIVMCLHQLKNPAFSSSDNCAELQVLLFMHLRRDHANGALDF